MIISTAVNIISFWGRHLLKVFERVAESSGAAFMDECLQAFSFAMSNVIVIVKFDASDYIVMSNKWTLWQHYIIGWNNARYSELVPGTHGEQQWNKQSSNILFQPNRHIPPIYVYNIDVIKVR